MRPRDYTIMARAVEEGVQIGWNRAHKHTERPDEASAQDHITQEVLNAITEVFEFAEGGDQDADENLTVDHFVNLNRMLNPTDT